MKAKLFLLFFLFFKGLINAQNPIWVTAPNYINDQSDVVNLPTGPSTNDPSFPFDYYDGKPALFSSNGIVNLSGELKFFIVDGLIYDGNGEYKAFVNGLTPAYELTADGSYEFTASLSSRLVGGSGFTIVPHPTECEQYYIFFTDDKGFGNKNSTPKYALYDHSLGEIIKNGFWYSNDDCNAGTNNDDEIFSFCTPTINNDVPVIGGVWGEEVTNSSIGDFTASNIQSDGSRFVFWAGALHLYIIKIETDGSLRYWKRHQIIPRHTYSVSYRSELEITQDPISKEFKVAFATYNQGDLGEVGLTPGSYLSIYHLSSNLLTQTEPTTNIHLQWVPQGGVAYVKGLEFSEDQTKLYFTHTTNAINFPELLYVDFESTPYSLNPLFPPADFKNSFIERRNNTLYFATDAGLYTLNNSNDPDVLNFSNFPEIVVPIQPNLGTMAFTSSTATFAFVLPDQIDDMDYSQHMELSTVCCLNNSKHDINSFISSNNALWQPGSNLNPFTSDDEITIKEELRIKEGTTLELRNMILRFAPEARLIIEHGTTGQGGKLILNNSTLSSDNRCGEDLWLGVQVWGNQNQSQGTMANSTQGRLEIIGNSRIENAHFGALASKIVDVTRNSQGFITGYQFDDSRNGGVIQTTSANFINNRTGVYLRKYLPFQSAANNISFFRDSKFMWSSLLVRNDLKINAHIELGEVRGIFIQGCTFENTAYEAYENQFNTVYAGGVGILSRASSFYALTSLSNLQGNQFRNMQAGIFAQGNQIQSFISNHSIFENNIIGILAFSTKYAKITGNTFRVRENTYQTGGLGLYFSTKYTVEENDFSEFDNNTISNGSGNTYGIVVNNSGKDNNEIYRNTFKNLKVGGQSEGNNATSLANNNPLIGINFKMTGLRWTCNTFISDIYKADLTVASGARINFHQGVSTGGGINGSYQQRLFGAARNSFSMVGESTSNIQHDLMAPLTAQSFSYAHLYDLNHTPDAYSSIVSLDGIEWNNNPMYMIQNGCPKRKISFVSTKIVDAKRQMDSLDVILSDLNIKLVSGMNQILLSRVNTASNISTVKNDLLAASPFLSDEILIAYLNRNPSAGHVKEVLVANSGLSDLVREKLASMSLPNGIRNQINQHQNKLSGRTQTVWERNYQESVREIIFNELIATLLAEIVDEQSFQKLIEILKENNDLETIKTLREIYLSKGDDEKIAEYKQIIFEDVRVDQKYKEVIEIEKDIRFNESIEKELREHPVKKARLEEISQEATELTPTETVSESKAKAKTLLEIADKIAQINEFEEVMSATSGLTLESTTAEISEDLVLSSVYPNPTRGELFIDFPSQEDGTLFITVYTIGGQLVERFVLENTNGERIDLSHLTKGLYLVDVAIDDVKMGTHKVQIK